VRSPSHSVNTSWVRLRKRDRAGNKHDGGQFCFHDFVSFPVAKPFVFTM
jgi:hypothetical protein